uniref:Uncharacterized protein n=1 Tax=Panagrolaimus sp. PS1159 TaxID=55785 RepID=A0AC35FNS4_9BILA
MTNYLTTSLLKAFTNIYDLCCLSVQCNLTFVDLVFALHLAILSTVLRSIQQSPESSLLKEQLTALESEMEIFYKNSGEKLTALRFITNQLSHFTTDFEIISQALKLKLQKNSFLI